MFSPSQHQRATERRRSSTPPGEGQLLSPSTARKNIKNRLISAIDRVADTLKQIPRAPSETSSSSTSATTESRSELLAIDEGPRRLTLGEKESKNRGNDRNGIDYMSASSPLSSSSPSDASLSPAENMYTPATNAAAATNSKKCDKVHQCITPASTTISATRKNQHEQGPASSTTTIAGQKISPNTIIIQNIEEDAKGITLKFNVKMIKPDGTPKIIDFAVEMPDFEPTFVKVGNKTAFLE